MSKKWYASKTLWVNVIAIGAIVAQSVAKHEVIPAEAQAGLLSIVNLILRVVTKERIEW